MAVLLFVVQGLVYLWTILTLPIYFLIYRPWQKTRGYRRKRAQRVEILKDQVTFRALANTQSRVRQRLLDQNVRTMDQILKYSVEKHGKKNCLGTRRIIEERQVPGGNGKLFTKRIMEPKYTWMSYQDVDRKSSSIGRGLQILGMKSKDKLVMYCDTKAQWLMTAMGCFKFNFSLVTIYTNLGEDGVIYGINQTEANYVCTSQELLPKLVKVLDQLPNVHTIVVIEESWKGNIAPLEPQHRRISLYTWDSVCLKGHQSPQIETASPNPDDIAILMYTSGSTGNPKAVMLTHGNLVSACLSIAGFADNAIGQVGHDETYIGYLPLAHVLELLAENVMMLLGVAIGYSHPNSLTDNSTFVMPGAKGDAPILKPSVMAAVPVVLDKIYKGINAKISLSGRFKSQLVQFCIRYRAAWVRRGYDTPIMNKLVFGPMRAIVGGRVKLLLSGGAPLAEEAHQFIRTALCLQLHQGYGLTETAATATITEPDDISLGRVGTPLPGVDIKVVSWNEGGYSVRDNVGSRGEIHIGGDNVSAGYYNMPDKTDEDYYVQDGKRWFKTGDIGQVMADGSFKIIDRKKDLVKLQMGEYVSLGKVESILKIFKLVDNVCVYARPSESHTVAIVTPDESKLMEYIETLGFKPDNLSFQEACMDELVNRNVLKELTSHGISNGLEKFEVPKQIVLVPELWTPDSGMVTAAMKLKRKEIEKKYANHIDDLYHPMKHGFANQHGKVDVSFTRGARVTPA